VKCRTCQVIVYGRRFERASRTCPECGWHAPLTARQRLAQLLDHDSAELVVPAPTPDDPLAFTDSRPYPLRLAEARESTGMDCAVLVSTGRIEGIPVVVAAMDFRFMGGSMGSAEGEAITAAAETALEHRIPLVLVTSSGGARMQEGVVSLMQMAKTAQAMAALDEAGILTVALVTDPTYGGVAASFVTLADVIVAEPGARMGFAGPRVIEQTIHERLPDGFQTAEFLLAHGLVDGVLPRSRQRAVLGTLLRAATRPVRAASAAAAAETQGRVPVVTDHHGIPGRPAWEVVETARDVGRPTTIDHLGYLLEEFVELHGDRMSGDCPAIVAGLGLLDGSPLAVIGHQKGHTAREAAERNFGLATPDGYRKAARVMRLAAKLGIPVLTLIDTPGAHPGVDAEQHGQAGAIADNLRLMSALPVPTVAVVLGEGGSGGALALAVADRVLVCENAMYSVISPEGCAAILWHDRASAPEAAEALCLDACSLMEHQLVDGIVPEPQWGAHSDHTEAAALLRAAVTGCLDELIGLDGETLTRERRRRFRQCGTTVLPEEPPDPSHLSGPFPLEDTE
jgi:acetyl-CoA carboxylase carboxyl transferase beta subunit/acetyl-CoA carboxylase carboxyl transferase alpha subunit